MPREMTEGRWWKARWLLTDGGPTYSDIWARDITEARDICGRLGFEEPKPARKTPSEFRVSRLAASDGLASTDVFHTLCYLSTLAARAGSATAEQLVGDGSPLHELSHYLGLGGNVRHGQMREIVLKRIAWLEGIILGMPPSEVDLPIRARMRDAGRIQERKGICSV